MVTIFKAVFNLFVIRWHFKVHKWFSWCYSCRFMTVIPLFKAFLIFCFSMFESKTLESKIEESNVGHQMLKKMGMSFWYLGSKQWPCFHTLFWLYFSFHFIVRFLELPVLKSFVNIYLQQDMHLYYLPYFCHRSILSYILQGFFWS